MISLVTSAKTFARSDFQIFLVTAWEVIVTAWEVIVTAWEVIVTAWEVIVTAWEVFLGQKTLKLLQNNGYSSVTFNCIRTKKPTVSAVGW
jgi:hypothetical protein